MLREWQENRLRVWRRERRKAVLRAFALTVGLTLTAVAFLLYLIGR
jgi:hypothetical protein